MVPRDGLSHDVQGLRDVESRDVVQGLCDEEYRGVRGLYDEMVKLHGRLGQNGFGFHDALEYRDDGLE